MACVSHRRAMAFAPSIPPSFPAIAQDRVDVLVDGASATYGSDAIAGVIKHHPEARLDGAISQLRYTTAAGGKNRYMASQLWGRTLDGGDITAEL